MTVLEKIGLGTVQFGIDYGITNTGGMTPPDEVAAILALADGRGIRTLDTAHLYGQSEAALGRAFAPGQDFEIVTKTPDFDRLTLKNPGDAAAALNAAFVQSLEKLRRDSVYGLMVHNAGGLSGPFAREIYDALCALKASGKVGKIGASVYTAAQIDNILRMLGPIDIVQVPVNLFDQRLIGSGYLKTLKQRGVEVHARSIFLQGALLADEVPPRLEAFSDVFERYHDFLSRNGLTRLQACLAFGVSVAEIDRMIIGVNNAAHLDEILRTAAAQMPQNLDFSGLNCDDEALINPAKWPKDAA